MKKREARQVIVQTLYQVEMTDVNWKDALAHVLEENVASDYVHETIPGILAKQEQIDEIIKQSLTKWSLDRLSRVDRAVLRLAVYEMTIAQHTPAPVIINEAVELGKLFGNDENGKFINGVLSNVLKQNEQN